jgi:peptide deformylase
MLRTGKRITRSSSTPGSPRRGANRVEINRYPEIKVRALDAEGRKVSRRYLDFPARIVQHEIDHLDGKLIVDYDGAVFVPKKRQGFFEKFFQGK